MRTSWLRLFILFPVAGSLLFSCSAPIGEHHPEWKKYFDEQNVAGCIEIYDLTNSKFIDYNPDRCAQRFTPASTFKICNSVIALETKAIPDTGFVLKWDSVIRRIPAWNYNQNMAAAFRNSTVWYYQEMATRTGIANYEKYLKAFHYGNETTGNAVDSFWLDGSLRISCNEQLEFLKNFYSYSLPVSRQTIDKVKGMMVLERGSGFVLRGKTGWGFMKRETDGQQMNVGWFVGYLEKGDHVFFFATNIEAPERAPENFAAARKSITKQILSEVTQMYFGDD